MGADCHRAARFRPLQILQRVESLMPARRLIGLLHNGVSSHCGGIVATGKVSTFGRSEKPCTDEVDFVPVDGQIAFSAFPAPACVLERTKSSFHPRTHISEMNRAEALDEKTRVSHYSRWEKAIKVGGSTVRGFQSDLTNEPRSIVKFFRDLESLMHEGRPDLDLPPGLHDFHLQLRNERYPTKGWYGIVAFNKADQTLPGPVAASVCMSCDMDCPLSLGCLGDNCEDYEPSNDGVILRSADTFLCESEHSRCWLDAKGRSKIIVTPVQHLRTSFELTNDQLIDMFKLGFQKLQEFRFCTYESMILNHGQMQNHAHLHLKITVLPYCMSVRPPRNKRSKTWFRDWFMHLGYKDLALKLDEIQAFSRRLPRHGNYWATHPA